MTWSMEEDHLVSMLALMGETFSTSMLACSELRNIYFNQDGKFVPRTKVAYPEAKLKNVATINILGIYQAITRYANLSLKDSKAAAEFIAACLHLDPSEQPSASDLMDHAWLEGADWCQDYRKPPSE